MATPMVFMLRPRSSPSQWVAAEEYDLSPSLPVAEFTDGFGNLCQRVHVFKVIFDPFVGKLALFRIHQGTVTKDSQLYVGDGRKPFKVGHLFTLFGKEHPEVENGIPGDIRAVAKVEEVHPDAILHDSHDEDFLHLQPSRFPLPVAGLAIRVHRTQDEQRLAEALHKLLEEDPCLALESDQATRETVLRGLSELHLSTALEQLKARYRLELDTSKPSVAYRETITSQAVGQHRHKKQTGGAGQCGEVAARSSSTSHGVVDDRVLVTEL